MIETQTKTKQVTTITPIIQNYKQLTLIPTFTPRLYQETILHTCSQKNCLVVLPTGMGKTAIAMMLAIHRLNNFPDSKILFVAPTKPLVDQHLKSFKKFLNPNCIAEGDLVLFTGAVKPAKRHEQFKSARVIFSTPQGLENDIISNKINLQDVSLLVIDECHRAVGNYAYVFLAKQFIKLSKHPKILALTASPGSELEKIDEVCANLFIDGVEIRTDTDADVKPYIQEVDTKWVRVTLPQSFLDIKRLLDLCVKKKMDEIKQYGLQPKTQYLSKRDLLSMQGQIQAKLAQGDYCVENLKSISLLAEAIKVHHALELLETQGITPLFKYFKKIFSDARNSTSKAVQNLIRDPHFKSAFFKIEKLFDLDMQHPKLEELKCIIEEETQKSDDLKIILFTQFRDSAVAIRDELETIKGASPKIFVGQAKRGNTGLSQKKQIEMLQEFRDGKFNILIATSVAEEGLDIPAVDIVLFYEPIPSAIRTIQRRGRTGRQEKGRVIILMASGTRDEGYHWSAKHKERRMHKFLADLKSNLAKKLLQKKQTTLVNYTSPDSKALINQAVITAEENKIKIFADFREKGSGVIKSLLDENVNLKLEMLFCADFVLSTRCAVEFKNSNDFVSSLLDGRLLAQLKPLKENFERPLIIVEGEEDIYSLRNIHPNAIRGMLATIAVSYGIPILFTRNHKETASLLFTIAKREQEETKKDFSLHFNKKPKTLTEQQEYLVSSLPNVGPSLAKKLLAHFKTISNIFLASEEELKKVETLGKTKASSIRSLIYGEYSDK